MRVKKGFTLIELLVVISIIALLLAIMMPALGKVKQRASSIWCLSNLRQVAIAAQTYSISNDSKLPNSGRGWPYMGFLDFPEMLLDAEYLVKDSLHCPWDKRGEAPGIVSDWWRMAMGGPVKETDHLASLNLPPSNSGDVDYSYYWPIKMYTNANANCNQDFNLPMNWKTTSIKYPAALISYYHFWCPINNDDYEHLPHEREGLHAGFMDGHSEFVSIEKIIPRDFNRDAIPDESQADDPLTRDNMDWTTHGIYGKDVGNYSKPQ